MTSVSSWGEFLTGGDGGGNHYDRLLTVRAIEAWHREREQGGGGGGAGGGGLPPGL